MTALRHRPMVGTRNPVLTARPAGVLLAEVVAKPSGALPGAACVGTHPDLFFPDEDDTFAKLRAKQICEGCPVRSRCLELALERREPHGIFGGLETRQRQRLLYRNNRRERLAEAATESGGAA